MVKGPKFTLVQRVTYIPCVKGMSSWDDKDWGWQSWDWDQPSWGQSSWDDWDWDWDDWDWEEDWKENWKGESLDKRQEESLDKRPEEEEKKTPGGQVPLMQPHCPKKGTTKADQLALGQ